MFIPSCFYRGEKLSDIRGFEHIHRQMFRPRFQDSEMILKYDYRAGR